MTIDVVLLGVREDLAGGVPERGRAGLSVGLHARPRQLLTASVTACVAS